MKAIYSSLLILFLWLISTITLFGQDLRLPIDLENHKIYSIAMLPDSSILLTSTKEDKVNVLRYAYEQDEWKLSPDKLSELLGRLSDQHMHVQFAADFKSLIVLTTESKLEKSYLIKETTEGEWGLPEEILKDLRGEFGHTAPVISNNEQYVSTTAYGVLANSLLTYKVEDNKNYISTPIEELSSILNILPISDASFLIQAESENSKLIAYYYIKKIDENRFSAPLLIKELLDKNGKSSHAVAITPFPTWAIYVKGEKNNLYLTQLPELIAKDWKKRTPLEEKVTESKTNTRDNPSPKYVKPDGNFHALLIANEVYLDESLNLNQPKADAEALRNTLTSHYAFDPQNVQLLLNANRSEIFEALYQLRQSLTDEDNLLIFYAGHGYWDKNIEQGYWWPVDARKENPSNWLSNSDLREQIRGIKSAHTLLISDACFSGGIFRTRGIQDLRNATTDIQLLYRMPSRRAISSGTLSTVPDKSVFFKYLNKYLIENEEAYLPSTELFTKVRKSVLNNSLTVPQDGVIMDSGDEGGDFIFIKRN